MRTDTLRPHRLVRVKPSGERILGHDDLPPASPKFRARLRLECGCRVGLAPYPVESPAPRGCREVVGRNPGHLRSVHMGLLGALPGGVGIEHSLPPARRDAQRQAHPGIIQARSRFPYPPLDCFELQALLNRKECSRVVSTGRLRRPMTSTVTPDDRVLRCGRRGSTRMNIGADFPRL